MPIHDSYLRLTPLERLLPDPEFPDRHFPAIESEAEERKTGLGDTGGFAMLEATGAAVSELRPRDADAESTHTHAILLFHAFHIIRGGSRHRLASTAACRWAVETEPTRPEGEVEDGPTPGAMEGGDPPTSDPLYWQLPQHLFWVRADESQPPASLDGFFRTRINDTIHVLGVTNVLGDGAGFEILPVPPAPVADLPGWAALEARPDGRDFHSTIPGAELESLYELRTIGEMLKLLSRLEQLATETPEALVPLEPKQDDTLRPSPSGLPSHRLTLR